MVLWDGCHRTQELQLNGIQQLVLSSAAISLTDCSLDSGRFNLKNEPHTLPPTYWLRILLGPKHDLGVVGKKVLQLESCNLIHMYIMIRPKHVAAN